MFIPLLSNRFGWLGLSFICAALLALTAIAGSAFAAVPLLGEAGQAQQLGGQQGLPTGNDIFAYPLRGLPPGALLPHGEHLIVAAQEASAATEQDGPQGDQCLVVDPSENAGTLDNKLLGADMVSASDGWAVGAYSTTQTTRDAMIQHWGGTEWSLVADPNFGANDNVLQGVTVISANDVWAVGSVKSGSRYETLTEHWNGTAWTRVTSPNPGTGNNILLRVDGDTPDNVWAVGIYLQSSVRTLVMHWDGTQWNVVPSANPGGLVNVFTDVDLVPSTGEAGKSPSGGSSEVWAVGYYLNGSLFGQTLIQRFDGTQFVVVPSPNVNSYDNLLYGIDSLSSNDIWVAGHYYNNSLGLFQTLIIYWNGTAWSIQSSENGEGNNYLFDISMSGPASGPAKGLSASGQQQGVAVGGRQNGNEPTWATLETYDEEFDAWHRASVLVNAEINDAGPSLIDSLVMFLAGGAPADPLDAPGGGPQQTWAASYSLACSGGSTPTPVGPTPTSSAATPTRTSTPALPTATPTACTHGQFSDVPPGSTFYQYVTCLVNQNVIAGYPDCTFRPGNNITRGQLAKVVSNAANFQETHQEQTFEDVAVGSTFHLFVERLASRGIVGGYACGGAGEPCVAPGNKPYFRPNASVTRGQTSKITAIAKGLPDPPSGQQSFQDVPEGSTFWTWIEALAASGAINGYACGGAGEPCVPPSNRPYFRPANNVTRGQASKIVANAFFPECYTPEDSR